LTLPGLEPRPLSRPARSQSLYRLRYPGSWLVRWCWGELQSSINAPDFWLDATVYTSHCRQTRLLLCQRAVFPEDPARRCSRIDLYTHGAQALVAGLSLSLSLLWSAERFGYIRSPLSHPRTHMRAHTHTHTKTRARAHTPYTRRERAHTHTHTYTHTRTPPCPDFHSTRI
jgi:hypothetical protein